MATTVGTIPKPVRMDSYGVLRVGRTRVSLDSVVHAFNEGMDATEIQYNYDTLTLAEIHGAISYYLHNKERIDAYLKQQKIVFEEMRERNHIEFPNGITRETLLARKNGEDPNWPPK